jgi:hypothetical protein
MSDKLKEILHELRTVVAGGRNLVDILVPPVLFFVLAKGLSFTYAVWGALTLAILTIGWRIARRQSMLSAVGGLLGVLLAIVLAQLLDREEGFFLPGIVTGIVTVLLAAASILAGRPMVAWTSHLARRWPRSWYWHPRVRPAYTEVTWLWTIYFLLRVIVQLNLFQEQQVALLAGLSLVLGWPATLLLLIVSYLYGTWRLRQLKGPSVAEFVQNQDPPWQSQQRGF